MIWFLVVAALVALAWLIVTWARQNELTFKQVIQTALNDMREIASPLLGFTHRAWVFMAPRLTNLPTLAIIALDSYATTTPEIRDAIMHDWRGMLAILALNLVARISPHGAPAQIPPPPGPLEAPRPAH